MIGQGLLVFAVVGAYRAPAPTNGPAEPAESPQGAPGPTQAMEPLERVWMPSVTALLREPNCLVIWLQQWPIPVAKHNHLVLV